MDAPDDDFLALPVLQQRAVDRAFDRGLRLAGKRSRPAKRRRLNEERAGSGSGSGSAAWASTPADGSGGGFMEEHGSGGFIPDDDGGGGFIPDDDGGGGFIPEDDGGGFMVDDEGGGGFPLDDNDLTSAPTSSRQTPVAQRAKSTSASVVPPALALATDRIPLRLVPSLLNTLGLPADNDVLDVFRASAEGWGDEEDEGVPKGKGKEKAEESVSRKDFRAVCAAIMPADMEMGDGGEEVDEREEETISTDDEDDEDAFHPSDDEDEFGGDDDDDDDEYGTRRGKKASRGTRAAASGSRSRGSRRKDAELREEEVPKLSGAQREMARELWDMLKPNATGVGSHLLGAMEVKRWAREMGEMWSEDEITDMVTLFSSQHEGRGLSFEDFGVVMMRAGLV